MQEPPHEPRGQEAIIQTLVGSKSFSLAGEVGGEAEGFAAARSGPEKHLQDEDVDVEEAY